MKPAILVPPAGAGTDYILNGTANGTVAKRLLDSGFNLDLFRIWHDKTGQNYMQRKDEEGNPYAVKVTANDATLMDREWIWIDTVVREAARLRTMAWKDLMGRPGMTINLPNAMGTPLMQYQSRSLGTPAAMGMDGLSKTDRQKLVLDLKYLPIPLLYKTFGFSLREIETSRRNGGKGLDEDCITDATAAVMELAENLLIGGAAYTYAYGGGTIYGYSTFPQRLTGSLDDPTGSGWVGDDLLQNLLAMRRALYVARHYGPYMVYVGPGWDEYLDQDFSSVKGEISIRNRMLQIEKIAGIRTLDFMSDFDIFMVEMDPKTIRGVMGFEPKVIKWAEEGGDELLFKVVACMTPNFRADYYGRCGLAHYSL